MESLACVIHDKMDLRIEKVPLGALGETQVLVRVLAGGICGSDLHYYLDGGFGTVRIKEPMILGHEVSGTVEAVGSEVRKVHVGDHISLNPSPPMRPLHLLPIRPTAPLSGYVVLRKRHARPP